MKNLTDLLTLIVGHRRDSSEELELAAPLSCPECSTDLKGSELYARYRVCPKCHYHFGLPARERIDLLADPGTFREVNGSLSSVDPLRFSDKVTYPKRIQEAQRKTGLADAVVTGICKIDGHPTVLAALDFRFLGGSMGSVVGEKIALAFELAIKRKLPIITAATSGGARMQEGMLSLVQMAKTAAAAQRLHDAKLPYISILANPTTGGVYSSFANLGDVILAEPRALIRFAGPRVVEQTMGKQAAEGSHVAEALVDWGLIDMVVDRTKQRDLLATLLHLLRSPFKLTSDKKVDKYEAPEKAHESAWETVRLARHEMRPTALDYIRRMTSAFVELHGDRLYSDDPAVVAGVADLSGQAVAIIGQERGHGDTDGRRNNGRAHPDGYRKAQRVMKLAAKFGLPVITFIDTPGAFPGEEAERRGLGLSLATSLALMSTLPTRIISVVIGEGGSGGALALGVADRVLMLEHAIYSVIAPEGAAAIIYRDAGKAQDIASSLKITAHDCRLLGVVDAVVPEPEGGAHLAPDQAAWQLKNFLLRELIELQGQSLDKLLKTRYEKFRRMGEYSSVFRTAIVRDVTQLQEYLVRRFGDLRDKLPRKTSEEGEHGDG